MHRRLIAATTALLTAIGSGATHAGADGTGDAFNDGEEIGAGAQDPGSGGGPMGGGGGGGSNPCRFERLDESGQQDAESLADGGWGQQPGAGEGAFYRRVCTTADGQSVATIVWLPEAPAVDPEQLAREALDRTPIPTPRIRLNPPAGADQLVNVPTWLWLDGGSWGPVSASASAGSVSVTTTASPVSTRWDMGNGDVVVCRGPGTPYDPSIPADGQSSDCTYT